MSITECIQAEVSIFPLATDHPRWYQVHLQQLSFPGSVNSTNINPSLQWHLGKECKVMVNQEN